MNDGYVLLHRQIFDNELWDDKPYAKGQAWMDLIMKANFKDVRRFIKGQKVVIKRGQLLRSVDNLAIDWGWSPNKVRRFLDYLKKKDMIRVSGRVYGTLITIENYERFQNLKGGIENGRENGRANGTSNGRAETIENYEHSNGWRRTNGTANGRADGRADGRGEKERKESKEIGVFDAPAAATVFSFFQEHGYRSDPEAFLAYYEGTGWKKKNGMQVTDWKSAASAWERREKQFAIDRGAEPASGKSNVKKQPEPPKYPEFEPEEKKDKVQMTAEQRERMKAALA